MIKTIQLLGIGSIDQGNHGYPDLVPLINPNGPWPHVQLRLRSLTDHNPDQHNHRDQRHDPDHAERVSVAVARRINGGGQRGRNAGGGGGGGARDVTIAIGQCHFCAELDQFLEKVRIISFYT